MEGAFTDHRLGCVGARLLSEVSKPPACNTSRWWNIVNWQEADARFGRARVISALTRNMFEARSICGAFSCAERDPDRWRLSRSRRDRGNRSVRADAFCVLFARRGAPPMEARSSALLRAVQSSNPLRALPAPVVAAFQKKSSAPLRRSSFTCGLYPDGDDAHIKSYL